MADLTTGTNQGICSVRKLGSQWVQPRTLSYNPAERSVLVTTVSYPFPYFRIELIDRPKRTVSMNLYLCPSLLVLLLRMERMFPRTERRELDTVLSLLPETDSPSWTRLARYVPDYRKTRFEELNTRTLRPGTCPTISSRLSNVPFRPTISSTVELLLLFSLRLLPSLCLISNNKRFLRN